MGQAADQANSSKSRLSNSPLFRIDMIWTFARKVVFSFKEQTVLVSARQIVRETKIETTFSDPADAILPLGFLSVPTPQNTP